MERWRFLSPMLSIAVVALGTQACALPKAATTTVSGRVWVDSNGDGIRQPEEGGKPGVTVDLVTAADSAVVATTTTEASGGYAFDGVDQLAYRVGFTLPDDFEFSPKDQGQDDSLDSDVSPSGTFPGQTDSFVPGQKYQAGWDAGLVMSQPSPTAVPATPEAIPSTPLPTSAPVTQVAGDYITTFYVAIDPGQNAPLVNLPSSGIMHVTQDGQHLTLQIDGADPSQTRLTFESELNSPGTATSVAANLVAGMPGVSTKIAGGFLRLEDGTIQISFTLEIGADGELPGGQEVVYSLVSD